MNNPNQPYQAELNQALLHIGMHKAASTYLQRYWGACRGVNMLNKDILDVTRQISARMIKGEQLPPHTGFPKLNIEEPGKPLILSDESLHGKMHWTMPLNRIDDYHVYCARMMQALAPGAKVLFIVRNPERWLLSLYNYSVKVGHCLKFSEYVDRYGETMLRSLDVTRIVSIYEELFGKGSVLVLPVEMLRKREMRFFAHVKIHWGFDAFEPNIDKSKFYTNEALPPRDMHVFRMINKFIDRTVANTGLDYSGYHEQIRRAVRMFLGTFAEGQVPRNKRFWDLCFGTDFARFEKGNPMVIPQAWKARAYEKFEPLLELEAFEGYEEFYRLPEADTLT